MEIIYFRDLAQFDRGFYVTGDREVVLSGPHPTHAAAEYAARGGPAGPTWRPIVRRPPPPPRCAVRRAR